MPVDLEEGLDVTLNRRDMVDGSTADAQGLDQMLLLADIMQPIPSCDGL